MRIRTELQGVLRIAIAGFFVTVFRAFPETADDPSGYHERFADPLTAKVVTTYALTLLLDVEPAA